MKVSLQQVINTLVSLGVDTGSITNAINELHIMLAKLDDVEVKGRANVDALLGCMMALEAIIGKDGESNS